MKEYSFTVTKTGWINVEADSYEDAEARLQENFGHYYVITETGEELSMGWETTGEVELPTTSMKSRRIVSRKRNNLRYVVMTK